jgi:hypothetical protein
MLNNQEKIKFDTQRLSKAFLAKFGAFQDRSPRGVYPQLTDLNDFWCTSNPYEVRLMCQKIFLLSHQGRGRARGGRNFWGHGYPQTLKAHNSASIWLIWMILVSFFLFFNGLSYELICNPKFFSNFFGLLGQVPILLNSVTQIFFSGFRSCFETFKCRINSGFLELNKQLYLGFKFILRQRLITIRYPLFL